MQQFDSDNNGYLDEKERKAPSIVRAAFNWDRDGDGQVFAEEIRASLAESALLESNRVFVDIMDEPKQLFNFVDADQDGRLGPRELAGLRERLLYLDANGSGEL